MKTIGITDFESLVKDRLTKPGKFAGRSLVLWNADYQKYGIAQRVITQCCEAYNQENPNDQVWFKVSDVDYNEADYTKPETIQVKHVKDEKSGGYHLCPEKKRCGIFFITGDYVPLTQEEQAVWLKLVNTHTNIRGKVSQDSALIVCAQAEDSNTYGLPPRPVVLKEQQFGVNCDVYCIQPTLDEWKEWAKSFSDTEILDLVYAYIQKKGVINGFDYWLRIMDALEDLKGGCSIRQIPEHKVEIRVTGLVTKEELALDFCKFIYQKDF